MDNALPERWVNEIFMRLHGRFGTQFLNQFATGSLTAEKKDEGIENAKRVWGSALADLTSCEIMRGLDATYSYPPNCDTFKLASRNYEADFHDAVEQMRLRESGKDVWKSPAIYWAAVSLGSDLANHPYKSIECRWKQALDQASKDVKSGKLPVEIPVRRVALPAPGKTSISIEEAKRIIAEMHSILQMKVVS